ncbi:phage portal protein [uncultured Dysosmobacter sp.]|uniref:phage portal protein n=1 Tax=uncultured Dysosmobacter sp. TaxID=2591384 RepID=UPI0026127AA5|nr:phage portal protein [uncultured Dysosmobacter sp.]
MIYLDKKTGLYLPEGARPKASGYSEAGASLTRRAMRGFKARSGSPNEDINWPNATLRSRGRMLYMSSPLATSAINTNRTKVVGVGLALKSAINYEVLGLSPEAAEDWQKRTEAEFSLWAGRKASCDALGINNFEALQQLALVSWLMSGDVFPLFKRYKPTPTSPYSLRIHMVEADRVSTPDTMGGYAGWPGVTDGKNPDNGNRIYDGVEVNSDGMVVAYHVCNCYPWQITGEPVKWTRVEAYGPRTGLPNILHVMNSERCDQYRGVTYLAQVIEPLLQLRRYTESELMAALVQSFFTAWIITKTDQNSIPINEIGEGDIAGVPAVNPGGDNISDNPNEYEQGPGTVLHLAEGEDVKFGNPNIPSTGFDVFVKTFCKLVGAGLGQPYDVLVKEYNSSYSSARAALLDAWEDFRMRRKWFVDDFCQPTYEVWLAEAVARGRIKAPGFFGDPLIRAAWCGARWIGPVQGSLDPLKEAKAAILQIQHGLKTHEQVTRETGGGDWRENVVQLAAENAMLAAAGGGGTRMEVDPNEPDEPDTQDGGAEK